MGYIFHLEKHCRTVHSYRSSNFSKVRRSTLTHLHMIPKYGHGLHKFVQVFWDITSQDRVLSLISLCKTWQPEGRTQEKDQLHDGKLLVLVPQCPEILQLTVLQKSSIIGFFLLFMLKSGNMCGNLRYSWGLLSALLLVAQNLCIKPKKWRLNPFVHCCGPLWFCSLNHLIFSHMPCARSSKLTQTEKGWILAIL